MTMFGKVLALLAAILLLAYGAFVAVYPQLTAPLATAQLTDNVGVVQQLEWLRYAYNFGWALPVAAAIAAITTGRRSSEY